MYSSHWRSVGIVSIDSRDHIIVHVFINQVSYACHIQNIWACDLGCSLVGHVWQIIKVIAF